MTKFSVIHRPVILFLSFVVLVQGSRSNPTSILLSNFPDYTVVSPPYDPAVRISILYYLYTFSAFGLAVLVAIIILTIAEYEKGKKSLQIAVTNDFDGEGYDEDDNNSQSDNEEKKVDITPVEIPMKNDDNEDIEKTITATKTLRVTKKSRKIVKTNDSKLTDVSNSGYYRSYEVLSPTSQALNIRYRVC